MSRQVTFTVSFELPEGASPDEAAAYVRDGMVILTGTYPYTHPMARLNRDTICVRQITNEEERR